MRFSYTRRWYIILQDIIQLKTKNQYLHNITRLRTQIVRAVLEQYTRQVHLNQKCLLKHSKFNIPRAKLPNRSAFIRRILAATKYLQHSNRFTYICLNRTQHYHLYPHEYHIYRQKKSSEHSKNKTEYSGIYKICRF